ncbi:CHAT domain-containing protein [Dapis sp. BLCC M126]|uniref:CHAT domain-containing protein n=1 Tax=Dapis sp. BLCC M126 TaxID=3400189 RepID=UPI003CEB16BD
MDEQRIEAYLNLINQLLTHPDEVVEILEANRELVDEGLLQVMEYYAQQLAENDDQNAQNAAKFLGHLRSQLAEVLKTSESSPSTNYSSEDYLNFLMNVLRATAESNDDPKVIYPLLQANLDKLDNNLADILLNWATAKFSEVETDPAESIASVIFAFSDRLREFPLGNKANNMEISIAGYEMVLKVFPRKSNPKNWAAIQNNLAIAYGNRIRGDRAQNLENAIAACNLALSVHTKKDFPIDWAMTQNNLSLAYFYRIRGDKAENLENAITAHKRALEVRTKEELPIDWATTQNNLANAYLYRIRGDWAQNLENAIAACNLALSVRTKKGFPIDWATTQNNLANAYLYRTRGDRAENLENAIAAYHLALSVRTKKDLPYDWAQTQNNLATAYRYRIRGDKAENLENAIAAYHLAVEVFTKKDLPIDWAAIQNNLAITYSERIRGDKAENLENAIAAYNLALEVYTLKADPINCLNTSRNLGNLHFKEGNWRPTIAAYEKAITAVELSRSWSKDDDRRQEILEKAIGVYQNIIQAYINTNQIEKALEYVERSRSKRLVDLMASNDLYSKGEIPAEVDEWLKKHEAIQQKINELWEQQQGDSRTEGKELAAATRGRAATEARNQDIAELEAQKQEVYKKIRSLDRVLADGLQVDALEFEKIQALIQQPTTAILSFYTTDNDTYLFIVRQNGVEKHSCEGQGLEELQQWLYENWFQTYIEISTRSPFIAAAQLLELDVKEIQSLTIESQQVVVTLTSQENQYINNLPGFQQLKSDSEKQLRKEWLEQMETRLQEIGKRLKLDELVSKLENIEELILVPHLYLHLIPFSAIKLKDNKYLGDHFRIRTLASCQILDFCTQRPEVTAAEYGIVEDTRNDLPCSSYEAQHIAKMYGVPDNQRLRGEAATVDSYKLLLSQVKRLLSTHHAQSRVDNCMESALLLADGRITLGQLLSPAFRFPDLDEVFIDCCETNFGLVPISDDVLTLNTGFLCAGARGVISSLWAVDDLGTCLFSIFYHQLRKEGKNRSVALQLAQRQLRELTGKELRKQYKKELEAALGEKLDTAYEQLKEIEVRRNSYAKDSAEYQELEEERVKLNDIYQRIYQTKNKHLKEKCKEEHPFEHPVYWSAFICAGLS